MAIADSSEMNSADVLQQIREQTSDLATGESQEETETQDFEVQAEQETQEEEEQPEETTQEVETEQEAEPQAQPETDRRIKVDGKEIEIPPEKVKEYLQKEYKFEERMRELKEKEKELAGKTQESIDYSKLNEEFVKQLQDNPVQTLMQFTKMVNETAEQERARQRKMDKALEREMATTIPHWDAISDGYHDRRDEGHDHQTAVALAERDLFINLYLESKQKGVQEGEKKAVLKQKAIIPGGNKRGDSGPPDVKDIKTMTSSDMAKALGMKFTKHPDW